MSNNKYKILVVEDDRSISGFVQTVLETSGYQVLTAQGNCWPGSVRFCGPAVITPLHLPAAP